MLTLEETRRYARQIALPQVGPEGQARLRAARVVVVIGGASPPAARTSCDYLRAAGVGEVALVEAPVDPAGWRALLAGASLVVRFGIDDDGLRAAADSLGVPVVLGQARVDGVELFPSPASGAAAVVLGTLAASEALCRLLPSMQEILS